MSLSDEEQLDSLKSFAKKYGSAMISGILIALIAFFGWEYWQKKNLAESQNQTAKVQKLMDEAKAVAGQPNAFATVSEAADKIVKDDADS
ncbi:tetratricopeptide repeat protein, partial [Acinetobacter ursingii]